MMTDWARALAWIAKLKSCTQSADAAQAPAAPDPPRRLGDEPPPTSGCSFATRQGGCESPCGHVSGPGAATMPFEEYAPSGSKPRL